MNGNAPSLATSIAFICITCYRKMSARFDKLKLATKRWWRWNISPSAK